MSGLILAAWLGLGAAAQEPMPEPVPESHVDPVEQFRLDLEDAKALWFRGERDLALERLERLYRRAVAGEPVPLSLSGECAIYLGEIQIDLGSTAKADAAFAWVLEQDPTYPISPYHHPIEVVGRFEVVRSQVREALPPLEPPPRRRYPAWGYAPFGIPQFRQGKPVRGGIYLATQATLAVVSIGGWIDYEIANPPPGEWSSNVYGWEEQGATQRLLDRKYLIQWPSTFGFYALWTISVLDGQGTFRSVAPTTATPGRHRLPVGIAGRW